MNEHRVLAVIQSLNYDFAQFTLPHFIAFLVDYRQRPLVLRGMLLEPDLRAMWIHVPRADYVIFNKRDHPLHQVHNILHEIGHILLDHVCRPIDKILSPHLLMLLDDSTRSQIRGQFRLDEAVHLDQEREAEAFVCELQRKIMFADQLDELTRPTSSIDAIERYTRALGYHG